MSQTSFAYTLRQHHTEIVRQISSIIFRQIDKINAEILTYFKEIVTKVTENLPKDGVQSRQAVFVRCCLKKKTEECALTGWEWGMLIGGAVLVLVILRRIAGEKHPLRGAIVSSLVGISTLTVINVCSSFTGVWMPVSRLSVAASALLGVPGVTAMLFLQLML